MEAREKQGFVGRQGLVKQFSTMAVYQKGDRVGPEINAIRAEAFKVLDTIAFTSPWMASVVNQVFNFFRDYAPFGPKAVSLSYKEGRMEVALTRKSINVFAMS